MTDDALVAELKATFLFEAFTDEQARWVADHADIVRLDAGAVLFTGETAPEAFWVLLDGEIEIARLVAGREVALARESQPGVWAGWLPIFEAEPAALRGRVTRPSRLLRLSKESMRHVIDHNFPLTQHLLSGIMSGTRTFEAIVQQREKLAALGRLAAGLAHELNNPAAAAKRAARDLRAALQTRDDCALALIRVADDAQMAQNLKFVQEIGRRDPVRLDPLERSDLEDAVVAWLAQAGIADADALGPSLVDASVTIADLDALQGRTPVAALPDAVAWLEAATTADDLARVIEESVARISALVAAIKDYSFMDRGDGPQAVDLHQGLDNTLLMLHHELKGGVEVIRAYDAGLPKVCASGGELNQVWTNLIENAIQAMGGKGRLGIRTSRDGERALVEIADNGPGVPEAIKDRIFEPFFTTKAVGVGTGLGLDIVRRIVDKHGGDIQVASQPGDTRVRVWLPFASP